MPLIHKNKSKGKAQSAKVKTPTGHHFADLGDEYYFNANVAYSPTTRLVEPWEPNITALLDPQNLKWKALVLPGTPIPTPWPKDCYESRIRDVPSHIQQVRAAGHTEAEVAFAKQLGHRFAGCGKTPRRCILRFRHSYWRTMWDLAGLAPSERDSSLL